MKNESCRAITNSAAFILKIFLASTGRVAVTEWGRSWGLGGNPSTSILAGAIRPKSQNMYMFALLAGFSYPVFLPFRAVFLQTRKEEAYTSSFSSSASFNLMAPSMTPSTMGRYFSGQSCNLWLVRWRCSLSSRSSSGLK